MSQIFLTAEWRNLVMANYTIDPAVLKPHVPCHTELDDFEGVHYVSLVGFLFTNTKIRGIAVPFHTTFEEVNLRFYVRYKEGLVWKRGVVFLKEIVPRRAITFVANTLYGEKYATHPMRHRWEQTGNDLHVSYEWKVGSTWNYIRATAHAQATPLPGGSAEEFITEHYWGYTFVSNRCTGVYQVAHPRWLIHAVKSYDIRCDAALLYGTAFAEALKETPQSVFLAAGSAVQVYKGARLFSKPEVKPI
jgi:uncharacterized protein YqjF (DUF2071 family)